MKRILRWRPQAREDLLDIYVTIGLDNPAAAERMYSAFEERVSALIAHPRMGMRRPEIAPSARVLVEGMYLILYETLPDADDESVTAIEIVRVIHGHRDLSNIF